jgi:hypothetical protein
MRRRCCPDDHEEHQMQEWLSNLSISWTAIGWGGLICVATFVVSIMAVGFVFVRMPANYFNDVSSSAFLSEAHPGLRLAARIGKNVLGLVLIAAGIIMFVTPGQGLLTLVLGILLLDFPGKRRLERKLVSYRRIREPIDALRARYGAAPLVFDDDERDPRPPLTAVNRPSEETPRHVLPRH